MIILHGIYNKGKIEIEEKDVPMIEAEVEIKIYTPADLKDKLHKLGGLKTVTDFSRDFIYEDR
ncbi:MAG: hypothetical protein A2Y33_15590 [Spirochaetes bacterium GWF1_51_8]|nr:MAG: hypothetical protein A2Y33_15590 [Spirochaetes bacterium GWF1_51_8]